MVSELLTASRHTSNTPKFQARPKSKQTRTPKKKEELTFRLALLHHHKQPRRQQPAHSLAPYKRLHSLDIDHSKALSSSASNRPTHITVHAPHSFIGLVNNVNNHSSTNNKHHYQHHRCAMRAYHMPSLPEIPMEQFHGGISDYSQMKLKVLYAVDDQTNFLARSPHTVKVKTARIPIPGQNDIMTLGVVPLKEVIYPVMQSSPELFNDPVSDYSVYVKDVSEEDEPFVGQGFVSAILNKGALDDEILVPGRVCSSFASLLNKGPSEILEIRLRLSKVNKVPLQQHQPPSQPQPQPQPQSQSQQVTQQVNQQSYQTQQYTRRSSLSKVQPPQNSKRSHEDSIDTEDEDDDNNKFVHPGPIQKKPTRIVNQAPAPKASRTQSLPTFEIVPPIARLPPQSIARRIYMADKHNEKTMSGTNLNNINNGYPYSFEQKSSPVDAHNDVSKRFAPDFITKTPAFIKNKNGGKKSTAQVKPVEKKVQPPVFQDDNSQPPICFHCKTSESKSWRWNNSEDESKRGMMCYQCYQYMTTKGVMRPKRLITKQIQTKKRRNQNNSSSPISSGNDTAPTTTPNIITNNDKVALAQQYYNNSSDPLHDLDDMINSDLDFNLGPMTDIDPFPQPAMVNQFSDDKENVPPRSISTSTMKQPQQQSAEPRPVSVRRASRQTSFEKMLAKSFSGAPPVVSQTAMTPSDWMVDLFNNSEPTPKDNVTPRDPDNTPRDITTCNTLPCNEDSPEDVKTNNNLNPMKVSAMPSSPMLDETRINTSPNSMNNWQQSDNTLSSLAHELPPKAHFQHDPSLGVNYAQ